MPGTIGRSGGDRKTEGIDLFPHDGLPEMPSGLTKDEQRIWNDLLHQLPEEMLRGVDVYELTILVRAIYNADEYNKLERSAVDYKERLAFARARKDAEDRVDKLAARFGLTPRDRQAIKFQPKVIDDAAEWERS